MIGSGIKTINKAMSALVNTKAQLAKGVAQCKDSDAQLAQQISVLNAQSADIKDHMALANESIDNINAILPKKLSNSQV